METEILNSLIEIKNTLKSSSPTWVPAAFALLGVFIAGFWQHLNSRVNLKAQNELKELEIRSQVELIRTGILKNYLIYNRKNRRFQKINCNFRLKVEFDLKNRFLGIVARKPSMGS
jgi:hypothetical protein